MAARGVSRLSESSESASDDPPPPPSPPRKVKAKPKEKTNAADDLDKKFSSRYTTEDEGYAEMIAKGDRSPPVIPEYQGRSYRGGFRGGGGGHSHGHGGAGSSRGYNRGYNNR